MSSSVSGGGATDATTVALYNLCKAYSQFHVQTEKLQDLNRSLSTFNEIFASFLLGIQLNAECMTFEEIPKKQTPALLSPLLGSDKVAGGMMTSYQDENIPQSNHVEPVSNMPPPLRTQEKKPKPKGAAKSAPKLPGSGGRKESTNSIVKKICQNLPLHMRDPHHTAEIEVLVKFMQKKPDGEYVNEIFNGCQLDKHHTMQYLNLLVKSGDILKISKKGLLYQLNPERFHI